MRIRVLVLIALVLVPHAAWPQGNPVGPEFRINTFTTNSQYVPATAAAAGGDFVVVWQSVLQDGSLTGVFGQRYASSGVPLGPEYRVNTFVTGYQRRAAVAADASGDFVVVWTSLTQDGSMEGVFGQRYASPGAPQGPEFRVNTYTTSDQTVPAVASDSSGNFVAVWLSYGQDGSNQGVYGQRYASTGVPLGPEFRVNTYTTASQRNPSVASDSVGNFVVFWEDQQFGSYTDIRGQRYASTGAPLGSEFRVNALTNARYGPAVASDGAGDFVVVWRGPGGGAIYGQRFSSTGASLGPEFRVDTYANGLLIDPVAASDAVGNFIIVWPSYAEDGSQYGIFGQRFASSGNPLGPEFRVNTFTTGQQQNPAVTADSSGNFVVVWNSGLQDGSYGGVFGQRFSPILPVELMHFRVE